MSDYVPQVGDKVRLEGEVEYVGFGGWPTVRCGDGKVSVPPASVTLASRARPAWTREPGAIGVDVDGEVWRRDGPDVWSRSGSARLYSYDVIPQPLRRLVPKDER